MEPKRQDRPLVNQLLVTSSELVGEKKAKSHYKKKAEQKLLSYFLGYMQWCSATRDASFL